MRAKKKRKMMMKKKKKLCFQPMTRLARGNRNLHLVPSVPDSTKKKLPDGTSSYCINSQDNLLGVRDCDGVQLYFLSGYLTMLPVLRPYSIRTMAAFYDFREDEIP
jgi:hypothetical protein